MKVFYKTLIALVCWMFFLLLLVLFVASVSGCDRRSRTDRYNEVPDMPADTVYVTKIIDRCNYQYINANPKIARKNLKDAIHELDLVIAEYDSEIVAKSKLASKKYAQLKILEDAQEEN